VSLRGAAWSRVEIKLATPSPIGRQDQPDQVDFPALYALAYSQVFVQKPAVLPTPAIGAAVIAACVELRVTPEAYVHACLLGHQVSCPERRFSPPLLISPSAAKRVRFYQKNAAARFGTSDPAALAAVTGRVAPVTLASALLASEELFGGWIVGERLRRGGNGVAALYAHRETALSPWWLATEPTYARWRTTADVGTAETRRHRQQVADIPESAQSALLRHRATAVRQAVPRVLTRHDLRETGLAFVSPVTSAFSLWLAIGDALMQRRLWGALHEGVLRERPTVQFHAEGI
jgi:hypothetical protein